MYKIRVKRNIPLSNLTTFKVGGLASYFTEVKSKKELTEAINYAKDKKLPIFVLGGGSDILVSDKGFYGLVIKYKDASLEYKNVDEYAIATAGAGMIWDDLVKKTVDRKLQGIECLSGIPGTVGAAPIQNIGAYGQELKDVFVNLTAYDAKLSKFVTFSKKKCKFGYRESIFKKPQNKGRFIITDITLKLNKNSKPKIIYDSLRTYLEGKKLKYPTLKQVRRAVLELRGQKLENPKIIGNAGSFFKNPIVGKDALARLQQKYPEIPFYPVNGKNVKLFAGWLIEKAGWKGKRFNNVMISPKNALVITNPEGRATAREIRKVANRISNDIYKKFRVKLEPEVQFIGFD